MCKTPHIQLHERLLSPYCNPSCSALISFLLSFGWKMIYLINLSLSKSLPPTCLSSHESISGLQPCSRVIFQVDTKAWDSVNLRWHHVGTWKEDALNAIRCFRDTVSSIQDDLNAIRCQEWRTFLVFQCKIVLVQSSLLPIIYLVCKMLTFLYITLFVVVCFVLGNDDYFIINLAGIFIWYGKLYCEADCWCFKVSKLSVPTGFIPLK